MTWGFRQLPGHGQSNGDREGLDRAPSANTRRALSFWSGRRHSGNIPPPQSGEETVGKINLGRVLVGGIVAGVIVDIFEYFLNAKLLADQWHALMVAQKLPMWGMNEIIAFDVMGLVIGLVAVWTYAAIRPRFGAGPKTAVRSPSRRKARLISPAAIPGISTPMIRTGPGGRRRAQDAMRAPRSPPPCGRMPILFGQGPERSGGTASQVVQRGSLARRRIVCASITRWKRRA